MKIILVIIAIFVTMAATQSKEDCESGNQEKKEVSSDKQKMKIEHETAIRYEHLNSGVKKSG